MSKVFNANSTRLVAVFRLVCHEIDIVESWLKPMSDGRTWECTVHGQFRYVLRSTAKYSRRNWACISCSDSGRTCPAPFLHTTRVLATGAQGRGNIIDRYEGRAVALQTVGLVGQTIGYILSYTSTYDSHNHWNCCHQMAYFEAKIYQIRFWLHGAPTQTRSGSLQRSPRAP